MKIFTFLITLAVHFHAFGCEIKLPAMLLVLGDSDSPTSIIENKNCDEDVIKELQQVLKGMEGKISSFQLREILSHKNRAVTIVPDKIEVHQFKTLIRNKLQPPSGVHVSSTYNEKSVDFLALNSGDKIDLHCLSCLYGQKQPVNVTINAFDGTTKTHTLFVDFIKKVKAYRLLSSLTAFSEINTKFLQEVYIDAVTHVDYLNDLQEIRFYKTNKPLRSGELLKKSDLSGIQLVRAGLKTEIVIENDHIRLKTHGISRSSGTLGEYVKVFNPQKNKKYQGKVIDINKVLVEI